ncbi:helix-turn-helix domain-containing protein [Microbacteriaceae bacterium K1510]|nr:helix-turn-helix domain-containing protein [Microbacteriaceae bacterium K1510]
MDEAVNQGEIDASDGPRPRAPEGMAGLAKGLAIIEAFGGRVTSLTVADAARASGTTRAAARRCLLTLTGLGYLEFDGKLFRPRPRMLRLGAGYLNAVPLPQVAQPILTAARDELEESVSLAVLDGDDILFIARAEARWIVSTGVRLGGRLAAYCSAVGRVLLTGWSDDKIRDYLAGVTPVARTAKTLLDREDILKVIQRARVEGVAFSDEELELGLRAMAVPVRDSAGQIVGGISLSAASARITAEEMKAQYLPALQRYAETLSRAL